MVSTMVMMQTLSQKTHMMILVLIIFLCLIWSNLLFMLKLNFWLVLLIILIYVSGVMVLFMYIVSLAPNEKNKMKENKKTTTIVMLMVAMMTSTKMMNMKENHKMNSSYKLNLIFLTLMVLMVCMSAYMPPKMMMFFYKGLKSSK